jgi:hypothetical protein
MSETSETPLMQDPEFQIGVRFWTATRTWEHPPSPPSRSATRTSSTSVRELDAARSERDRLRQLCAELYQVAGALGADARVLDNLWAAAEGKPLPHESLLPYPHQGDPDV